MEEINKLRGEEKTDIEKLIGGGLEMDLLKTVRLVQVEMVGRLGLEKDQLKEDRLVQVEMVGRLDLETDQLKRRINWSKWK